MSIECAFEGRVGGSIVVRHTNAGKRWVSFSLAAKAGKDGEAEWVNVAVFEPLASEIPDDLGKGERVYVEGKLRVNRWEATEGTRCNLQVAASHVLVLDRIGRRRRRVRRTKRQEEAQPLQQLQDAEAVEEAA